MGRNYISSLARWLRRVITQPWEELDRWQRAVRFAYDLGRFGARQLRNDRAPQMAAALAFRTLFALLPVLIVATIVTKGIRGTSAFIKLTHDVFSALELDEIRMVSSELPSGTTDATMSLAEWLEGLIGQAASVDLVAVGWVGVAVIGYAAISLVVTVENSFNTIYGAPEGRPWTRRIPLYWFVLTVSPVAIGVTWYLNGYVSDRIELVQGWQTLLSIAEVTWSIVVGWLVLLAFYTLMPNTNVAIQPALAGALVAALLLEFGKRSLGAYLENAFSISQLYGSLGLVPLFMFWVYLMWLGVLFGLEVSATLQMLGGRDLEEIQPKPAVTGLLDPAAVVTVTEVVAERFASGQTTTARQIAESKSLPESVVALIVGRLVDEGILHRVEADTGTVALARPPESVTAEQLIDIGFRIVDDGRLGRRSALVERLRDAQRQLVSQTTLATLLSTER